MSWHRWYLRDWQVVGRHHLKRKKKEKKKRWNQESSLSICQAARDACSETIPLLSNKLCQNWIKGIDSESGGSRPLSWALFKQLGVNLSAVPADSGSGRGEFGPPEPANRNSISGRSRVTVPSLCPRNPLQLSPRRDGFFICTWEHLMKRRRLSKQKLNPKCKFNTDYACQ